VGQGSACEVLRWNFRVWLWGLKGARLVWWRRKLLRSWGVSGEKLISFRSEVLQKVVDESEKVLHNLVSVLHENVHAAVVLKGSLFSAASVVEWRSCLMLRRMFFNNLQSISVGA